MAKSKRLTMKGLAWAIEGLSVDVRALEHTRRNRERNSARLCRAGLALLLSSFPYLFYLLGDYLVDKELHWLKLGGIGLGASVLVLSAATLLFMVWVLIWDGEL